MAGIHRVVGRVNSQAQAVLLTLFPLHERPSLSPFQLLKNQMLYPWYLTIRSLSHLPPARQGLLYLG